MNNLLTKFLYSVGGALKNLPDAVFYITKNGKILKVNKRATDIFYCNKSDLKKYHFNELITDGIEQVKQSIKSNCPVIACANSLNKDFLVELNAKIYLGMYIVTVRDITAITNTLSNATQTDKFNMEKNIMLVKLSNEIKSPLNSIIGFSQALLDNINIDDKEKTEKYIRIINKSAKEFLNMMEHFIGFSYAESSVYEHEFKIFDITNTLQNILKENRNTASLKNIDLLLDLEDYELSKRLVYTDEKTLKCIINNLLQTSISLTETGTITIKLTTPQEDEVKNIDSNNTSFIKLSISDTGVGIQENELANLFKTYEQIYNQTKRNTARAFCLGTAKILTERLKGIITVNSEIMKGTVFNVIIPVEEKDLHE